MVSVLKNIGIVLLLVVPFYLWSIYDSFFEEHPGYIYDPASDQLYWLELQSSIYRFQHWKRHLLPFSSPRFTQISYIERQASLTEELAEQNRPFDPEAFERETEQLEQELHASKDREIEFIDAEYWARNDLEPKTMLPPSGAACPKNSEILIEPSFPRMSSSRATPSRKTGQSILRSSVASSC